jgi:hypothetical protein
LNALEEQLSIKNQSIKEYFQNFMEARPDRQSALVVAHTRRQPILDTAKVLQQPDQFDAGQHGAVQHTDFVSNRGRVGFRLVGQDRNEVRECKYSARSGRVVRGLIAAVKQRNHLLKRCIHYQ